MAGEEIPAPLVVAGSYIQHVLTEGKAIASKNKFETLAMDPQKKENIVNDLVKFKQGKEYYAKVGKAWKRGYLLFGPPGIK
ncbi:P-loop containing nucleoside triphosphate hydrolase [Sesbania bispinosa]|nr:P-loop containing nucleoside triphosphate hydrolase [Sesbania bispinosa]